MTLVTADLVFAEDRWRANHGFVLQGPTIIDTGEPRELAERHPDHERADWGAVAVLPGTVNAHGHSYQSILRGLTERASLPMTERLDREAIATAARFDFAELAKAGVTTTVDVVSLHDRGNETAMAVAHAAREVGLRLVVARSMSDWSGAPKRAQETPAEAERNVRDLHAGLRGDTRVFVQPAPHSIAWASPEMILRGAALAAELGVPFHVHAAERRDERDRAIERHGVSPVAFLDSLAVLSERALLAHCVWVGPDDLAILRDRGARVVHTPSADAFAGRGVAPVVEMLRRGIPVSLGTDGGSTNGRQSVFEEMRMAALLARAASADGSALGAAETMAMGTARGGEALGLPVGRIAADHAADVVVVDLDALSVQPAVTAASQIVFAMQPEAIVRVIVGGETIVERGRLTRTDESEIVARVREATRDWPAGDAPGIARDAVEVGH
jgi:5-methylthioadenosine/S-adenosylhomocysteine deaminase